VIEDIINPTPARQLINDFYYQLPNNGSHKEGLLSCEKRYNEAITCSLISVDKIIEALEHHSWQNRKVIEMYQEIKQELIQIQNEQNRTS
jgi:hypothetical protein